MQQWECLQLITPIILYLLTDFKVEKKENNRFNLSSFSSELYGSQIIS